MSFLNEPIPLDTAQRIVTAVEALPQVAGMHTGTFGEVALLYAGDRVRGLKTTDETLQVHVCVNLQALGAEESLHTVSDTIRRTVAPLSPLSVDVIIADASF